MKSLEVEHAGSKDNEDEKDQFTNEEEFLMGLEMENKSMFKIICIKTSGCWGMEK